MKPILFNTEMVRAILEGRKTVTRRVIKYDPKILESPFHKANPKVPDIQIIEKLCTPPYEVNDVLYVRETWAINPHPNMFGNFYYKANKKATAPEGTIWRPSIHMPKEAARIFLRVKNVRVERLQEIDIRGIRNEGLSSMAVHAGDMEIALEEWKILWNSTLGRKSTPEYYANSWSGNPYVWVIEFENISDEFIGG